MKMWERRWRRRIVRGAIRRCCSGGIRWDEQWARMVERRRVSAGKVCFGCRASVVEVIAGCPEGVNGMVHRPKSGDSSDVRMFVLFDAR